MVEGFFASVWFPSIALVRCLFNRLILILIPILILIQ